MLAQCDALQMDGRLDILNALLIVDFLGDSKVYLDEALHGKKGPVAQTLAALDRVEDVLRARLQILIDRLYRSGFGHVDAEVEGLDHGVGHTAPIAEHLLVLPHALLKHIFLACFHLVLSCLHSTCSLFLISHQISNNYY